MYHCRQCINTVIISLPTLYLFITVNIVVITVNIIIISVVYITIIIWRFQLPSCVPGVCNFSASLLMDLFTYCRIPPAVNQIELHPRNSSRALVDYCHSKGNGSYKQRQQRKSSVLRVRGGRQLGKERERKNGRVRDGDPQSKINWEMRR